MGTISKYRRMFDDKATNVDQLLSFVLDLSWNARRLFHLSTVPTVIWLEHHGRGKECEQTKPLEL